MKAYLVIVGVIVVTVSIFGGAIFLSGSYEQYQRRIQAVNAPAGSPLTLMDEVKWEISEIVGIATLAGGVILGSLLIGLGWIGKTLEDIRDAMLSDPAEMPKS